MPQEMSAHEMFEKLGYVCEKTNGEIITYRYYTEDKSSYIREIDFLLDVEKYCTFEHLCGLFIGVELHKAITKQMKELGWLG